MKKLNNDYSYETTMSAIVTALIVAVIIVMLCIQPFSISARELACGANNKTAYTDVVPDEGNASMRIASVRNSVSSIAPTRYEIGEEVPVQSVTLQAVVMLENATNKNIKWNIAWKDPDSEWSNGKTVTDYVSLEQDKDSSTVTVNCLQVFCEQIIITATSEDNEELTASCTVDYKKRITGVNDVHFGYSRVSSNADKVFVCIGFDQAIAAGINFIKGDGSVNGEIAYDFAIYGSDKLAEVMQDFSCSGRPVTPHTYADIMNTGDPEHERMDYIISDSTTDLFNPTFKFTEDWFYEHICNIPRTWFTSDEQWRAAYDRLYDHLSAYSNSYDTYQTPEDSLLDGVFTIKYNGIEYIHKCKVPLSIPPKTVSATSVGLTHTGIEF